MLDQRFHLLIGLYQDKSEIRTREIINTFSINLANEMIEKIHVFWEDSTSLDYAAQLIPQLTNDKVVLIHHGKRLFFADLFSYANTVLVDKRSIIANNDIFFGNLDRLIDYNLKGRLLALTRWDIQPDGSPPVFLKARGSADAWIFQAPINLNPQYHLGYWCCDARLNLDALEAGILVSNPSLEILIYHNHLSGVRNYSKLDRVQGGIEVIPSRLIWPKATQSVRNCKLANIKFKNDDLRILPFIYEASSHSNSHRPFINLPPELFDLKFTQVVSCKDSATQVECFDDGLLYILVERNWNSGVGQFLQEVGANTITFIPEPETLDSRWEVWGLPMTTGRSITIPRQVLLVTDNISHIS